MDPKFYAFGESYGGAYVISLAHVYLKYRENDPNRIANLNFEGIGIGNGFVSAIHQSKYADYIRFLSFVELQLKFSNLLKYLII